jgi:hypothetical protein
MGALRITGVPLTTQPGGTTSTPAEAKLYREWIANDRRMRLVIDQVRKIAARAADL